MNSNALVTIIVPVYNNEVYIEECLNNILEQTYSNLQIIVVDDGSKDNTFDLCKNYTDERLLLLKKENGGASSARNYGLKYAKGDYIYFADSDDHLNKDAIEILVNTAAKTEADCVYFEAINYTEDKDIEVKKNGLLQKTEYKEGSGRELIPQLLKNKDYHAAPFLYFVKRHLYEDIRFEEGIMFEDELYSFRILYKCEKVVCLRNTLYNRRVRAGSVMTSTGKEEFRFYSITRVLQRLVEIFGVDNNDSVVNEYIARIGLLWFGYWKALDLDQKNSNREMYDKIRKMILSKNGFDSRELVVRCYGYYSWIAYILPGRLIRRIKRRRLK